MIKLKPLAVAIAQMALVYAGEFGGIEWAANVGLFMAWFLIVAGFLGLLIDPEQLYAEMKPSWIRPYIDGAIVLFFAAAGWTFTAMFWMASAFGLYVKYQAHAARQKEKAND